MTSHGGDCGPQRDGVGDSSDPVDVPAAFDVFLSYNSADRSAVTRIARNLRRRGVEPWFDRWSLTPGGAWQDEITEGLLQSSACAVFMGPDELGAWERLEISVALNRAATERSFRLFLVLLTGLEPFDPADLPPLLATRTWVDLRDGPDSDRGLASLVKAVHGVPFGPDVTLEPEQGPSPYRGLEVFDEQDARFFFGREAVVQRVTEKLRHSRFLAVVGPSGSGKSSLVRAGLLPRVRSGAIRGGESWRIAVLRPGAHPLAALAGRLLGLGQGMDLQSTVDRLMTDERTLHLVAAAALADGPPETRVLVVVDQCEELFTLCRDPAERQRFLRALHYASMIPGGRTAVVLTLRADFYARLTDFPDTAQLVQSHQQLVGGMTDEELRQVIEEPARVVGLEVEPGLVETVLADVVREPGTLPLLEHALLETWRRRRGGTLTLEGYRDSGGVQRGLAERAEALYTDLSPQCQEVARHVLLRLTQPGEGTEDTRRQAELREVATGPDAEVVEDVVRRFVAERLLTTSADDATGESWVEVSHEALIRGWPRLQGWIDADRAGLVVHRRLTFAVQEWQRHGQDAEALYRGARLTEALALREQQSARLNAAESEFLQLSEQAEHRSRTARQRRRRLAVAALTSAVVAISVVALVAVDRGREAVRQRDVAVSQRLAASAGNALAVDQSLSLALALRAIDTSHTPEAEVMVRRATAEARGRQVLRVDTGPVRSARMLPGQRVVGVADDGRLRIWDLGTGHVVADVPVHDGPARRVRPTPDGQRLLSIGNDHTVVVTDVATATARVLARQPDDRILRYMELSRDGLRLVLTAEDGSVRLLDSATGTELWAVDLGEQPGNNVAFSPDGRLVAVAGRDGSVELLNASDGARSSTLRGHVGSVTGVDFSPTGAQVLTAGVDGTVRRWDVATGRLDTSFPVAKQALYTVACSAAGDRFVTTGMDGAVRVWDMDGVELAVLRGHVNYSFDATFDDRGETVVSAGQDGTVRTWGIGTDDAAAAPVVNTAVSPDGRRAVAGGTDGHVRVWDTDRLVPLLDLPGHTGRIWVGLSGDGRRIVSAGEDGIIRVRDVGDGRELAQLRPHVGRIWTAALDADGNRVVSGGADGNVVVNSLIGGGPPQVFAGHGAVYSVAFGPDGRSVLSGGSDGTVRLWSPDGRDSAVAGHAGEVFDVVFSPDGRRIGSAGADGTVRVWSVDGAPLALLRGHDGTANGVRFGPDGTQVVTGGQDGTVRTWDVSSSRLLLTQMLHTAAVTSLDISRDGRTVVSASEASQVLRTSTCDVCGPLEQVAALARSRPVRTLTADEEQRWAS